MKRNILTISFVAGCLLLSSCVTKKQFTDLQSQYSKAQTENESLRKSLQDSQVDLASCNTNSKNLQDRLKDAQNANKALANQLSTMQGTLDKSVSQGGANIAKLVDQINEANQYIRQLVNAKSKSDSLNMVLTTNLTRSLNSDEQKEVNVKVLKGVVYISLADNMLYKSGSYEINDRAGETLSKIAKIINDYKDYGVLIEGNTDNVPINRTNIRNNWDLSALRASSVVQALQTKYGVDPKRLTVGGRGEYNPVATNTTEVGRQLNRRTQIIITPKLDEFMDLIGKAPEESTKE